MNSELSGLRWYRCAAVVSGVVLTLALTGCGSSEGAADEWETVPAVSPTAKLEYRLDSLSNENRRMRDQVNAMAVENRNLTARNAELETRLNEAMAAPKAAAPVEAAPAHADGRPGYEGALAQYNKRNFTEAISQFDALLKGGIQEDLADNCYYWMGESYYGLKKYDEAIQQLGMVFKYKTSEKKADAQMMIGNCYAALGDKGSAKSAYEKVVANYPRSPLAAKAQERIARLK